MGRLARPIPRQGSGRSHVRGELRFFATCPSSAELAVQPEHAASLKHLNKKLQMMTQLLNALPLGALRLTCRWDRVSRLELRCEAALAWPGSTWPAHHLVGLKFLHMNIVALLLVVTRHLKGDKFQAVVAGPFTICHVAYRQQSGKTCNDGRGHDLEKLSDLKICSRVSEISNHRAPYRQVCAC